MYACIKVIICSVDFYKFLLNLLHFLLCFLAFPSFRRRWDLPLWRGGVLLSPHPLPAWFEEVPAISVASRAGGEQERKNSSSVRYREDKISWIFTGHCIAENFGKLPVIWCLISPECLRDIDPIVLQCRLFFDVGFGGNAKNFDVVASSTQTTPSQ